jgi:hypothetical protein
MSRPTQGLKRTIFRVLASEAKRYHCKVRSDRQLRLWQEVVRIFDWRSRLGGLLANDYRLQGETAQLVVLSGSGSDVTAYL